METQTLEIKTALPSETMQALVARAREVGATPESYVLKLIVADLEKKPALSFNEILAPFRKEVSASGIADDELDSLFLRARRDYAQENKESD